MPRCRLVCISCLSATARPLRIVLRVITLVKRHSSINWVTTIILLSVTKEVKYPRDIRLRNRPFLDTEIKSNQMVSRRMNPKKKKYFGNLEMINLLNIFLSEWYIRELQYRVAIFFFFWLYKTKRRIILKR